ncbi:alpha/beta hydrolase [Streptomyces polyrhachis]|uniref:Alpha/beta hydrolase n=1 Tax=Streptomyces polyrhachis TaxID=1282885 RepID=A0ABW2GEP7_9ACTN
MRAALLYGVLGSLALTGLAGAPATAAPPPESQSPAQLRQGVRIAVRAAERAGVDFGSCPASEHLPRSVDCGTVKVPLDYDDPRGEQIKLLVSRTPARRSVPAGGAGPAKRSMGALVFNPGGPGASGTYFPLLANLPEWRNLSHAYDFVGYAPRGVSPSAPLSCQDPAAFAKAPSHSPARPTAREKAERVERAKAYAAGCAANRGVEHYTSVNNARDLEVLRAALHQPKLNYLGASYGTYFGALYATAFPDRVGRFVLDGPVDPAPNRVWYANNLLQSVAFEDRWRDFRHWAAKGDPVYGLGATPHEVLRSYEKVRAAVEKKPAGGRIGTAQLHAAMLKTGYADDYWPIAATALAEYLEGSPRALVEFADIAPQDYAGEENGNAVYTTVECNDAEWPTSWATWDQDASHVARMAPFETWDNTWMNLPCAFWKSPRQQPVDVNIPQGELPPVLILAAERDAATPYAGARSLHRRLGGSTLVTERGSGSHGIAGGANACVNTYVDRFLLEGRTPGPRADCAPHALPTAERRSLRD